MFANVCVYCRINAVAAGRRWRTERPDTHLVISIACGFQISKQQADCQHVEINRAFRYTSSSGGRCWRFAMGLDAKGSPGPPSGQGHSISCKPRAAGRFSRSFGGGSHRPVLGLGHDFKLGAELPAAQIRKPHRLIVGGPHIFHSSLLLLQRYSMILG